MEAADLELIAELIVPADVEMLAVCRTTLAGVGAGLALSDVALDDLKLVLSEVCGAAMERTGGRPAAPWASSFARRRARSRSASATVAATRTRAGAGSGSRSCASSAHGSTSSLGPTGPGGSCASRRRFRPDGSSSSLVDRAMPFAEVRRPALELAVRLVLGTDQLVPPGETRISSSSLRLSAFASRLDVCWTAHTMIRVTSDTTRAVVDSPARRWCRRARSSRERAGRRRRRPRT